MSWGACAAQADVTHRYWALDYSTGAQEEFWGPGVLPLPDFLIAPYPAPPGAPETSQMGLYIP